jgi:hypothetical protein
MAKRLIDVISSSEEAWRRMSETSHAISQRFSWPQSARRLESALLEHVQRERAPAQLHRPRALGADLRSR